MIGIKNRPQSSGGGGGGGGISKITAREVQTEFVDDIADLQDVLDLLDLTVAANEWIVVAAEHFVDGVSGDTTVSKYVFQNNEATVVFNPGNPVLEEMLIPLPGSAAATESIKMKTITINTVLDNSYNKAYVWVLNPVTITIPAGLRPRFTCVFRTSQDAESVFEADGVALDAHKGTRLPAFKMATLAKFYGNEQFTLEGETRAL